MNRSKKAKALSAGAIANLALAGFVASPAGAATHGTTGSAAHPAAEAQQGKVFTIKATAQDLREMSAWREAQKVSAVHNPRAGFVPGPSVARGSQAGARPNTYTYCSGHTCFGIHGHGLYVSYVDEHFFNWNKTCHHGNIWIYGVEFTTSGLICSAQNPGAGPTDFRINIYGSFSTSGTASGNFNNVPPYPNRLHGTIHR